MSMTIYSNEPFVPTKKTDFVQLDINKLYKGENSDVCSSTNTIIVAYKLFERRWENSVVRGWDNIVEVTEIETFANKDYAEGVERRLLKQKEGQKVDYCIEAVFAKLYID